MSISTTTPVSGSCLVTLNVGGTLFTTTEQTLRRLKDTFLDDLFTTHVPSLKDCNGNIFIDRDPGAFRVILNYLRTNEVTLCDSDIATIKIEAEFYRLTELVNELNFLDGSNNYCGGHLFRGIHDVAVRNITHIATSYDWLVATNGSFALCYVYDSTKWVEKWRSPSLESPHISQIKLNAKYSQLGENSDVDSGVLVALQRGMSINLFFRVLSSNKGTLNLGTIDLTYLSKPANIDSFFFVAGENHRTFLCALGYKEGILGVWDGFATEKWTVTPVSCIEAIQDVNVQPDFKRLEVTCHDSTHTGILLLGCKEGSVLYIDMQKLPKRMIIPDNNLHFNARPHYNFTEVFLAKIFQDDQSKHITSISAFDPSEKNSHFLERWLEVAYGTSDGFVRLFVNHPDTGQVATTNTAQLFQTFHCHTNPVVHIRLAEKNLISVCTENHVKTWKVNRFRGMLSGQPGCTFCSSYVTENDVFELTIGQKDYSSSGGSGLECVEDSPVLAHYTGHRLTGLCLRSAPTGSIICEIFPVHDSPITSWAIIQDTKGVGGHRLSLNQKLLITGHANGSLQIWDLALAFHQLSSHQQNHPHNSVPNASHHRVLNKSQAVLPITVSSGNGPSGGGASSASRQKNKSTGSASRAASVCSYPLSN